MEMQTPAPANDIQALRSALFETLNSLKDKDHPMDIERAKAINDVAQTIVNTAKVEVDALKVIGGSGTGFIPALPPSLRKEVTVPGLNKPGITHPAPGVTRHTCE